MSTPSSWGHFVDFSSPPNPRSLANVRFAAKCGLAPPPAAEPPAQAPEQARIAPAASPQPPPEGQERLNWAQLAKLLPPTQQEPPAPPSAGAPEAEARRARPLRESACHECLGALDVAAPAPAPAPAREPSPPPPSSPASPASSMDTPAPASPRRLTGVLWKRGFRWRKLWVRRLVSLCGDQLSYFEQPAADNSAAEEPGAGAPPRGEARLTGAAVCAESDIDGRPHAFAVRLADGPTWYLAADSDAARADWMAAVAVAVARVQAQDADDRIGRLERRRSRSHGGPVGMGMPVPVPVPGRQRSRSQRSDSSAGSTASATSASAPLDFDEEDPFGSESYY